MTINERAAKDCEFYGHRYVGQSNCVYCNTPQLTERNVIGTQQEMTWT